MEQQVLIWVVQWVKFEGDGERNEEKCSNTSTAWLVVNLSVFLGQAGTLTSNSTHFQTVWLQACTQPLASSRLWKAADKLVLVISTDPSMCPPAMWTGWVGWGCTRVANTHHPLFCSPTQCPGSGHSYHPASAALHIPGVCLNLQREADDQCWGSYWADPVITCSWR